jgi:hypothetical protein
MICQATLMREYTRRPDGLFQKIVAWDGGGGRQRRMEILIRDSAGELIRVERKGDLLKGSSRKAA